MNAIGWLGQASHVPLVQPCHAEQAVPQPPQLLGSVAVSTHVSPQQVWPRAQVGSHCPVVSLQASHAPHGRGTHVPFSFTWQSGHGD
jgi:hypothetical protein